jgi:hypothetical protein
MNTIVSPWIHIRTRAALSLSLSIVGSLWITINLLRDFNWEGHTKAWVLMIIALWPIYRLLSIHLDRSQPWKFLGDGRALGLIFPILSVAWVVQSTSRTTLELAWCVLAVSLFPFLVPLKLARWLGRTVAARTRAVAIIAGVTLSAYQVWLFIGYGKSPDLGDIATTTLDAVSALLSLRNPYSLPLDIHQSYPEFSGYKYPPAMALVYLPLSSWLGAYGLRLTNLILELLTAALAATVAKRTGGTLAGILCGMLYLTLPLIPYEIYKHGVTDLAPMALAMASLVAWNMDRRISGLFVGLSIAAKLFPGVLIATCSFEMKNLRWYVIGGLVGGVPALLFLAIGPHAFVQNIFLFVLTRPVDESSWMYGEPAGLRTLVSLLYFAALSAILTFVTLRKASLEARCNWIIIAIVLAMLAGPDAHNNYIIWWAPIMCVSLSVHIAQMITASMAAPPNRPAALAERI